MKKKEVEVDPIHALISNQVKMWKVIRGLEARVKVLESKEKR